MDDFISMMTIVRTASCYKDSFNSRPKQYGKQGDVCVGCGMKLSFYNPFNVCSTCVGGTVEGIMGSTDRTSFRLMKHKRQVRVGSERVQ